MRHFLFTGSRRLAGSLAFDRFGLDGLGLLFEMEAGSFRRPLPLYLSSAHWLLIGQHVGDNDLTDASRCGRTG